MDKKDVYYYTKKQPFEETAKLPLAMAKPLHQLVMTVSCWTKNQPIQDKLSIIQIIDKLCRGASKNYVDKMR